MDISYTAEEIAKLLKISKLTVYDLIKKGELPSYRVGKQMRVDASDLEAYKQRHKAAAAAERQAPTVSAEAAVSAPASLTPGGQVMPASASVAAASVGHAASTAPQGQNLRRNGSIVITGQDMSLDILARHLESRLPGVRFLRSYDGSLDSLVGMYRGESDIVSTHLLDGDTGEYNLPYIRKLLIGSSYLVVRLLTRSAGLYVQKGNPLGLAGWADLNKQGLRLANRERGAGARVLLDEQLRLHGIRRESLIGYDAEHSNHLSVAAKVASGEADIGVGTARAAAIVERIDYIPLVEEHYDLVVLKKPENAAWIEAMLDVLKSDQFARELGALSGYDLSSTGHILYEC